MSWEDDLKTFMDQAKEEVIDLQKDVAKTAMDSLFLFSPHHQTLSAFSKNDEKELTKEEKQEYAKLKALGLATSKDDKVYRRAEYAHSEYDANHKISTDKIEKSGWTPPTLSHLASNMIHSSESQKIDSVSDIGDTISIENISGHANEVETGTGWKVPAYKPYEKTTSIIRSRFAGQLNEL